MYSSFGYLESEAEDLKVLESAGKALKAGGRLLLDMLNREWAIDNYIQNDWHTGADGTLYVERRDLDLATSRMHVHFIVVDQKGGRRESIGHNIRLYTLTEMTRLLERVGMRVTAVFGGFEGEDLWDRDAADDHYCGEGILMRGCSPRTLGRGDPCTRHLFGHSCLRWSRFV